MSDWLTAWGPRLSAAEPELKLLRATGWKRVGVVALVGKTLFYFKRDPDLVS